MDISPEAVLDFGPRCHDRSVRFAQRSFILWPAWAWQVVVPITQEKSLNPLQRVVLRLAQAGTCRYEEIGALLGLHPELIACIGQELMGWRALSNTGQITPTGKELLESTLHELDDLAVAWVFADGLSGKLFPHLTKRLSPARVTMSQNGHPQISAGTKGRPYTARAFVMRHDPLCPPNPTAWSILDAARRHRLRARRFNEASDFNDVEAPIGMEQVQILSDSPARVHLMTWIYVPEEPDGERPWYVADPFGLGASPRLAESLEQLREHASGGVSALLDKLVGAHRSAYLKNFNQAHQLFHEEAAKAAVEALPPRKDVDDGDIHTALTQAYFISKQAAYMDRLAPNALDAAYMHLRQALEAGLGLMLEHHPPGDVYQRLRGLTSELTRHTLRKCALRVGFAERAIPLPILKAKYGTLRYICTSGPRGHLRPVVAILLLCAAHDPNHGLRRVATAAPTWLAQVDHLADQAGEAVHTGDTHASLEELDTDLATTAALLNTLIQSITS